MENRPLRIMPNNQEAEQSVIGSMILDKNAIATVLEKLQADDFHRDGHKIIFQKYSTKINKFLKYCRSL